MVHADDGLDELSTLGPTRVSELARRRESVPGRSTLPRSGIPYARLSDLQVNSADESAAVIREILDAEPSPARDIAAFNAAGALVVAGYSPDLPAALARAFAAIDDGSARSTLAALVRWSNE